MVRVSFAFIAVGLWIATYVVANQQDLDISSIVAARFVSCSGCRLNRLPRVRNFMQNEAPKYPAATVEWIGGHNPEVHFLNKHKKPVVKFDLGPYDEEQIHALLHQHNIHLTTPAPTFEAPSFEKTKFCIAWRQTGNCDPNGEREALADESCLTEVANGRSGYCECIDRPRVEFGCEHTPITCEYMCRESVTDDTPAEEEGDHEEF